MTMKTEKRESLVRLGCVSTDTRGGWGDFIESGLKPEVRVGVGCPPICSSRESMS